jgi:hypothetical protein
MNGFMLVALLASVSTFPPGARVVQAPAGNDVRFARYAISSIEDAMDVLPGEHMGAAAANVGYALNHALPDHPCSASWHDAQGQGISPTVDEAMVFYSACNLIQARALALFVPLILESVPQHG